MSDGTHHAQEMAFKERIKQLAKDLYKLFEEDETLNTHSDRINSYLTIVTTCHRKKMRDKITISHLVMKDPEGGSLYVYREGEQIRISNDQPCFLKGSL